MMMQNDKKYGIFYLKLGLLLFWFLWFGTVFLSNLVDLLHVHYGLFLDWKFHSGNYQAIEKVISIYNTPHYILDALFYVDLLMQATASLLFLIAAVSFYTTKTFYWKFVNVAYIISISLWCAFLMMEEIFLAYPFESVHMRLCIFEILTLLLFHLLQDRSHIVA